MKKQESINVEPVMMSPETPTFELTGDFDVAKAQKSMKGKAAVLTGLIGLGGLSIVATGCPQPTDNKTPTPPSCQCAPNTEHLPGKTGNCGSMINGCTNCIEVPGTTVHEIPVTNRESATNFNTIKGWIEEFLNGWNIYNSEIIKVFQRDIIEIEISNSKNNSDGLNNGKLIINNLASRATISNMIENLVCTSIVIT